MSSILNKQTIKQANRQTSKQTNRQTDRDRDRDRDRQRQTDKQTRTPAIKQSSKQSINQSNEQTNKQSHNANSYETRCILHMAGRIPWTGAPALGVNGLQPSPILGSLGRPPRLDSDSEKRTLWLHGPFRRVCFAQLSKTDLLTFCPSWSIVKVPKGSPGVGKQVIDGFHWLRWVLCPICQGNLVLFRKGHLCMGLPLSKLHPFCLGVSTWWERLVECANGFLSDANT